MKWLYAHPNTFACVDDEDYEELKRFTWGIYERGYVVVKVNNESPIYLHQMLVGRVKKPWNIDHINRDKLDNRKCNLRVIGYVESNKNRGEPVIEVTPSEKEKLEAIRQWRHVKENRHLYSESYAKRLRKVVNVTTNDIIDSIELAAKKYHAQQSLISHCCQKVRHTHAGCVWEYYNPRKHSHLYLMHVQLEKRVKPYPTKIKGCKAPSKYAKQYDAYQRKKKSK